MTSEISVTTSVGIRRYASGLCIAQMLQPPYLSAADDDVERASGKLREAIADFFGRAHPGLVARLMRADSWYADRVSAPIYRVQDPFVQYDEEAEEEAVWADVELDVAARDVTEGLVEVLAPAFSVRAHAQDFDAAIDTIVARIRALGASTFAHCPTAESFELVEFEATFTPVDLLELPVEELWQSSFTDDVLERHEATERPATPTLDAVADLWSGCSQNEAARLGFEPTYARALRIDELEEMLGASSPTPVVIVGAPRCGKTALIKHLAWSRRRGQPEARRLWFASAPRLCATDAMSAGWQQQCRELFAELETADEILYVGRLVEALDAGKFVGSEYNLAQFAKPLLADRRLRVVAEATPAEWNIIEQRDIGFARTFHVVRLDDPVEDIALSQIVVPAAVRLSERESIEITREAILRAWNLQHRFASDGSPIGRTIDFLARVARQAVAAYRPRVDDIDLVRAFCDATGLPQFMLLDERTLDLEQVVSTLAKRVMGQDAAVRRVADVIGITKAGLASPDRPLGSFLFVGPTGVGKTELARSVAEFLFGDEDRLVRLDMSEYSHPDAYSRLIGEGGVVQTLEFDHVPGGDLTGPVRRQPFCVVLLDEIEKAHPSVFDLLLQVLGEARLTDVHGRTTRFQNTLVIMTSNLGVDSLRPSIGFSEQSQADSWSAHFRREAERFFRPEFLARIDQVIPFQPLSQDIVTNIARRELVKMAERDGVTRLDVAIDWDEDVPAWIAKQGWDPQYGARPIKRVIERHVAGPLATVLASTHGSLTRGQARQLRLERAEDDALTWRFHVIDSSTSDHASRQALLEQIEQIAGLRRRLQTYMYTDMYSDLEWEIENFDVSSQSEQFWQNPGAAQVATRAEQARRIVGPAEEVAVELAALEDLANEAYYSRSFELLEDLEERLAELRPQVRKLFMVILRSAFERPDEFMLFLAARKPNDPWRAQLVAWYHLLAERYDFTLDVYRVRTDKELVAEVTGEQLEADPRHYYKRADELEPGQLPNSSIVALRFSGFAARPLLLGEDGLHRLVASESGAVVDVFGLDEASPWPLPEELLAGRPNPPNARVWNRRTREVTVPYYASVPFVDADPWEHLVHVIEEVAWMIVESRWD